MHRTTIAITLLASIVIGTGAASADEPIAINAADTPVSPDGDPPILRIPHSPLGGGRWDTTAEAPAWHGPRIGRAGSATVLPNSADVEGDAPTQVLFTPDGTQIVVSHRDSQNLIVFDAATRAFVREIAISGSPQGVAITPDGTTAITANLWEDTVSFVDLASGTETGTVAVGDQPGFVRITPDGLTALVGNTVSGDISVIDIATMTETQRIAGAGYVASLSVSFEPGAIAPSFDPFEVPDNNTIMLPEFFNDTIS
ncbi:MAG: YncE family protein, partial [Planctomycetota bacterium]